MARTHGFSRNIPLYYAAVFTRSIFLLVSINVLYYFAHGLSLTQVLLLGSMLSLGVVALEIPTGVFADRYGRKTSLLLSGTLLVVGYLLLAFGSSFWIYLLAMVAMAASMSFQSGADSALVYDSLVQERLEHQYRKVESRAKAFWFVGTGIGALLGSVLYAQDIHYPYYAMVLLSCVTFLIVTFMREPQAMMRGVRPGGWAYAKEALRLITHSRALLFVLLFDALAFATVNVSFRFFQPLLRDAGVAVGWFGLVYAVILLLGAAVTGMQDDIERTLERRLGGMVTFYAVPVLLALGFLFLAGPLVILLLGMFLVQLVFGYLGPLIKAKAQELAPARERATTLSMLSFAANLVLLALSPLIGYAADAFGITFALYALAVLALFGGFCILLWHNAAGKVGARA